jgi:drug/metabolite transporter (DMT)-like permease
MQSVTPHSNAPQSLPAGAGVALLAAALFGVSTPFAKLLLGEMRPVLLAGLLYLGSGLGLSLLFLLCGAAAPQERRP